MNADSFLFINMTSARCQMLEENIKIGSKILFCPSIRAPTSYCAVDKWITLFLFDYVRWISPKSALRMQEIPLARP